MRNTIDQTIQINNLSDLLLLLNNNLVEIRFYLSSNLLKEGTISSISLVRFYHQYLIEKIIMVSDIQFKLYTLIEWNTMI